MGLRDLTVLSTSYNKLEHVDSFLSQVKTLRSNGCNLVVIDDGSTDGSFELLESAAALHDFMLIRTENKGSAAARNRALMEAKSDYFLFLDLDDALNIEALIRVFHLTKFHNADISTANFRTFPEVSYGSMPVKVNAPTLFDMKEIRSNFFDVVGYWRSIYNSKILKESGIRFLPTFEELDNNFFILDDLYWLAQVSALDIRVLIFPPDTYLYEYFRPVDSEEAWKRYLTQLTFMTKANSILLTEASGNHRIDYFWLQRTSNEFLYQHLKFLNLSFGKQILIDFRKYLIKFNINAGIVGILKSELMVLKLLIHFTLTSFKIRKIYQSFKRILRK